MPLLPLISPEPNICKGRDLRANTVEKLVMKRRHVTSWLGNRPPRVIVVDRVAKIEVAEVKAVGERI